MQETIAANQLDVIRWINSNKHHEGWWGAKYFTLKGDGVMLRIPVAMHDPELFAVSEFEKTGHLYVPSVLGRALLGDEYRCHACGAGVDERWDCCEVFRFPANKEHGDDGCVEKPKPG